MNSADLVVTLSSEITTLRDQASVLRGYQASQIFLFIHEHRFEFRVEKMCEVLGVSRSGYYKWRSGYGA